MKFTRWLPLLSLLFWSPLSGAPVKRAVLGLYNSQEASYITSDNNLIHTAAELPLNYLGATVRFHDIAWGIPTPDFMEDVFAILSWTGVESSVNAQQLCSWLTDQVNSGLRLVLMGQLPFLKDSISSEWTSDDQVQLLFAGIGLAYEGGANSNPLAIEIDWEDQKMMGFERPLEKGDLVDYLRITSSNPEVQPYLLISKVGQPHSQSIGIATTPNGGYALNHTALYNEVLSDQSRWYINPFLFFERALGLEGTPRYDTTTLFGRRIYYSHIDGDGLRNLSYIDQSKTSGQIVFEEVLQRYPLPFTASFISAEVDPTYLGTHIEPELAKEIFNLSNVESGSHGFTHPLNWSRGITVFAIPGYSVELDPETAKGANELVESGYKQGALIIVPPKEWYYREVVECSDYLTSHLSPKEKPVRLYQWTGDCLPPALAIRMAGEASLLHINGGDGRLDRSRPTYTGMAPLCRQIEQQRQTYTSNANEDIYTNGWHGPYYAQIYVIETYKQTEIPTLIDSVPRRVAPMNLYFHYYSGEREDSLYAIRYVLEYILSTPCIPIRTSHYCEIVNGFFSGKIERVEGNGWRFSNYGKCQTVRFDRTALWPDLDRSAGVLGYQRWADYLYVHLSEQGEATLYLIDTPPKKPYLSEASAPLERVTLSLERIEFETEAIEHAAFQFRHLIPNTDYQIVQNPANTEQKAPKKVTGTTDEEGSLDLLIPIHGRATIEITPAV